MVLIQPDGMLARLTQLWSIMIAAAAGAVVVVVPVLVEVVELLPVVVVGLVDVWLQPIQ